MDRTQWRKERRLWNEVQMDTLLDVMEGDEYRHYLVRKEKGGTSVALSAIPRID